MWNTTNRLPSSVQIWDCSSSVNKVDRVFLFVVEYYHLLTFDFFFGLLTKRYWQCHKYHPLLLHLSVSALVMIAVAYVSIFQYAM
jgi:hypothetical protein